MEYVRSLKFDQDPDYDHAMKFFYKCQLTNQFEANDFSYTWKQNRLKTDKESLKASLKALIDKKPKKNDNEDVRQN